MNTSATVQKVGLDISNEGFHQQLISKCSLPAHSEYFNTDTNDDSVSVCNRPANISQSPLLSSTADTSTVRCSIAPCSPNKTTMPLLLTKCSFNRSPFQLPQISRIHSSPSIFSLPTFVDDSIVGEVEVAAFREKSPSAATNTTAATNITATSLDLFSQDDSIPFARLSGDFKRSPLKRTRSSPSIFSPNAFVDESHVDEIEVALNGPSAYSSVMADGERFTKPSSARCSKDKNGNETYSNAFQGLSDPEDFLLELEFSNIDVCCGIPNIAIFRLGDAEEDSNSCITLSTMGGNASFSSVQGEREEPESGPHMLCCFHEQEDSFDNDTRWCNNHEQPLPASLSINHDRGKIVPAIPKHQRSRRKGIGHVVSKIQTWCCK